MIRRELEIEVRWFAWLCGLFEGSGTFSPGPPSTPHRPRVGLVSIERDIMARVCDLWGTSVYPYRAAKPYQSPTFRSELVGGSAVALMQLMHPEMGARRQAQIDAAVASFTPSRKVQHKRFTLVSPGEAEVDRYWLAGYAQRYASFDWRSTYDRQSYDRQSGLQIVISSSDHDVIRRAQMICLSRYGLSIDLYRHIPRPGYNSIYRLTVNGQAARFIADDLYPLFGERQRTRIERLTGIVPQSRQVRERHACYDVRIAA